MKILAFLHKTCRENLRDWKILSLTLVFAPFFVFLMYGYFAGAAPRYRLVVVDRDAPESAGLVAAWRQARHADNSPVFELVLAGDLEAAQAQLRRRDADLVVEIPAGFARHLDEYRRRPSGPVPQLVNYADQANLRSPMAMALSDYCAYSYVVAATGTRLPLEIEARPLPGQVRALTEFDLYVPALLVLALVMVLFTSAATLLKEVDRNTISRLMLSRLRLWELLAAVSANQVLIGTAALALAFVAAWSVGYRSDGSLLAVLVVGAVSTLAVVAIGVLVAAFLNTIFELLTVGCFPFFVLMFFSDCMFPLPKIPVFQVAGNAVNANDILPTSLTVRAFGRILNHGAGLSEVGYELGAILLLTAVYYLLGAWLFWRRHYRVR